MQAREAKTQKSISEAGRLLDRWDWLESINTYEVLILGGGLETFWSTPSLLSKYVIK